MSGYNGLLNVITQGDCIEVMTRIPDKSVDMILCDLPYGTTACKWDTIVPFEPLWAEYERVIKDNGAIVLTASQPFTSALVMSNTKLFKYEWVWEKDQGAGFVNAKNSPLKKHENILVFSKGTMANGSSRNMKYYPQGLVPKLIPKRVPSKKGSFLGDRPNQDGKEYTQKFGNYPHTVLGFAKPKHNDGVNGTYHPTQKPIALFEYLIKTYTNEGEVVLDNCIGSGTTAVAAINTNRKFIGIEREPEYVNIARERLEALS